MNVLLENMLPLKLLTVVGQHRTKLNGVKHRMEVIVTCEYVHLEKESIG
jgi:hypothetical protein